MLYIEMDIVCMFVCIFTMSAPDQVVYDIDYILAWVTVSPSDSAYVFILLGIILEHIQHHGV